MKSIRTKIVNVLFASVILTVVAILIVSVISMNILSEQDSNQLLKHIGEENVSRINSSMSDVKASVCGFSRGTTVRSVSLSWGAREVGSPCEW